MDAFIHLILWKLDAFKGVEFVVICFGRGTKYEFLQFGYRNLVNALHAALRLGAARSFQGT